MTAVWKDFEKFILPWVPGAGTPLVHQSIRNAVITLCERARVWRVDVDNTVIPIVAGTHTYALDAALPANTSMVTILDVLIDDVGVDFKNETLLDLEWPRYRQRVDYHDESSPENWRSLTGDVPICFYSPLKSNIRIVPIPETTGNRMELTIAVKPTVAATGCTDLILEDYWPAVKAGALSELLSMPKKEWYDINEALRYEAKFEDAIQDAHDEARASHPRADQPTGRVKAWY